MSAAGRAEPRRAEDVDGTGRDADRAPRSSSSPIATRACGIPCSSAASAEPYSFGSRSTTSGRHSSHAARSPGSAAVVLSRPKISPTTTSFASSGGSSGTRAQTAPSSSSGGGSNCQNSKPGLAAGPARSGGPADQHLVPRAPERARERHERVEVARAARGPKRARTRAV